MKNSDTGLLLNEQNIKLARSYFKQFLKLHGLNVLFRAPLNPSKDYNDYGELDTYYEPPIKISCIWDEHPNQRSMQKAGWNTELSDTSVIVHVPYDVEKLQAGSLFIIPSGLDDAPPRTFRLLRMQNIAIYPASITCELAPVIESDDEPSTVYDFKNTNFNMLDDEHDEYNH